MARRPPKPSLKDKGAAILFPDSNVSDADDLGERASKLASKQADEPETSVVPTYAGLTDDDLIIFEAVIASMSAQGRITASFRFTQRELSDLEDVVYRSRRKHSVRLAKQDVVRMGLAALLAEHKQCGSESVLGRYISHLKER